MLGMYDLLTLLYFVARPVPPLPPRRNWPNKAAAMLSSLATTVRSCLRREWLDCTPTH